VSVRRGVPRRSSYGEIIVHTTFPNTRVAQNQAIVSLYASDPAYDVRPTDLSATDIQMRHHNNAWFDNKSYYAIWSTVESIGQKSRNFFRRPLLRSRPHSVVRCTRIRKRFAAFPPREMAA